MIDLTVSQVKLILKQDSFWLGLVVWVSFKPPQRLADKERRLEFSSDKVLMYSNNIIHSHNIVGLETKVIEKVY